jgi:CRISPR system Cascade subunit CasE
MTFWSIQIDVDVPAAARAVSLPHDAKHDPSYLLKTVLTEAFAGPAVRPWTVHRQDGPIVTVLGYSDLSKNELAERAALALPAVRAAITSIHGHLLPVMREGQRYRFSVRLCPTLHVTPDPAGLRRHGERDAFLAAIDRGEEGILREVIYTRYLVERLKGARVDAARLTGFRLVEVTRPHRGSLAPATGVAQRVLPEAEFLGVVTVMDSDVLAQTVRNGIGRHRAFGRGYVRLEPERPRQLG